MLPLTTRRRARRRTLGRRTIVLGVAVLVTVLVVGGLLEVSRNSGTYSAQMNRTFGAQVTVLADSSNATAASVRSLMDHMASQSRQQLQAELDNAVDQTSQQQSQATMLLPAPPGAIGRNFSAAFSDRAQAVSELRSAVDGLLGLHPLAVAGSPVASSGAAATPTLLSSTATTNQIAAAGALLTHADRAYGAMRKELAAARGHTRVPASVWVTRPQSWQLGAVATQIDQLTTSASLAAAPDLMVTAIRLSPPALPQPSGVVTPGVSTLSPTNLIVVSVVMANHGTVDEPAATVHISLVTQATGQTVAVTRHAALASLGSVTVPPALFVVKPGQTYGLHVTLDVPALQTSTTDTAFSQLLIVAPATPTTTVAK